MSHTTNLFCCLSGSTLKLIAICAMAIDHFAASIIYHGILLPAAPLTEETGAWTWYMIYKVMRFIGRIAFPIFCFLLVEETRKEPGNQAYQLIQSREFPNIYAFMEQWPSQEALDIHMESEHFKKLIKEISKIVEGSLEITTHQIII